jgi:predicted amidohydrolase YtcJ
MRLFLRIALLAFLGGVAQAQPADTVLVDGKVLIHDGPAAQALAVRGTTIAAVGSTEEIGTLIGPQTRVIDLAGRTVIPGLIDSHIHAIRAGLTWQTELNWIGVRSLSQALDRIREKAKAMPPGTWLVVAGGWTPQQFAEERSPTQAEIAAAAPAHHVYVQLLYSRVLLSPGGIEALGLSRQQALAAQITIERDRAGAPTGWLTGEGRAISRLFDLLPQPTFEQKIAGSRAFFRELNRMGLTGIIDPGGYNLSIADYQPLFEVWRERRLTLRVRYSVCAPRAGHELEDLEALTQVLPMGFGDDWLRFNGIGENVTWGMYNNEAPSPKDKERLAEVLRWAASRRLTATFHWNNEHSVHHLLEVLERVNAETPLAGLRWSIAHLHDASKASLARMKTMGIGWLVQNALYFRGEAFLARRGADVTFGVPPIVSAIDMGLRVGGGTDAHRVMWPNPFVALQWMLDGKTIGGVALRAADELPSRIQALRLFTEGSAWFAFEEGRRGRLAPGWLADLAVLTEDYLTVPVERIGSIASVLTMVGGQVVYADIPFAGMEQAPTHGPPGPY